MNKMMKPDNLTGLLDRLLNGEKPLGDQWTIEALQDGLARIQTKDAALLVFEGEPEKLLLRKEIEVGRLVEIGRSLSSIRDLDRLLFVILEQARMLASADAGSIYVVEGEGDDLSKKQLHFKLSQNESISYESKTFAVPISAESIAGAAALMKKTINIPDVRALPESAPYRFDSKWDEKFGYSTRSVIAVPMINLYGEVQGVVQLINKKRNPSALLKRNEDFDAEVIPMDAHTQELVETLASQAGVAMENAFLYDEIQRIFSGFIRASVHAVEQRDPATSGHSFRVAALTRGLAEAVSKKTDGPYANIRFTEEELKEIETAALLHDFGKVGVREEVLVKAKKLYPPSLKMIRSRFDFVTRSIENDYLHRRLMMLEDGAPPEELEILDQSKERAINEIDSCWRIISSANEPTVLQEGDFAKIEEIAMQSYFDIGGRRQPYLEEGEVRALQIAKGSLTEEELREIRSHAEKTISFLKQIPWGRALRRVPDFAGAHHEKLDGTGYPFGLKSEQIPLPAKMMAIADIYDALTAADRPYKKAVPKERALHILDLEAKDRHIDAVLLQIFKDAAVYNIIEE
jgi:HD-GYP domain-containing protein (c-di-GMP phosphodiesterase class II)